MDVEERSRQRRRRGPAVAGVVFAVLAVVVGYAALQIWSDRGSHAHAASVGDTASCAWQPVDPAQDPYVSQTGTPPTTGLPASGTRAMTIATNRGTITVSLDVTNAPCSAASFTYLAGQKFFDNTTCHRLTTNVIYVLQCGDPRGDGSGGPAYVYAHENLPTGSPTNYPTGTVAMANANDPDGNGSQFFIVYKDTPIDPSTGSSVLAANFTVIGKVTGGLDVVQQIAAGGTTPDPSSPDDKNGGKPKLPVTITTVTVGPVVGS